MIKKHLARHQMKMIALVLLLLLTACENGSAENTTPPAEESPAQAVLPELEKTDWPVVSTDAEAFDLNGGIDNPNFEYVFQHTGTVSLDQLIAFCLVADGLSEGAWDELYHRFLDAPNTVLSYLALMGDQITELQGWEPTPTSELICQFIGSSAAAWYGDTGELTQTITVCREAYPEGRIAELLDVMEEEYTADMKRWKQSEEAMEGHIDQ